MSQSVQEDIRATGGNQEGSLAYLLVICLVAAIGGLLFGFDTAVISGAIGFVKTEFDLSSFMKGWTASSALVGCMLGAAIAGVLSDRFGRKWVMVLSAFFFFVSAIGCGLSRTVTELIAARILGGMGIGIASMVSPMYIAEISPPKARGRLVSLQQFAIITGILGAYFSNTLVLRMENLADEAKWRWMFALGAFPAVVFFLLLVVVPESPRWLVKQGLAERARAIIRRIAGNTQADLEMVEIQAALKHEDASILELFKPGWRIALVVGVVLAILQQITGINAILYYAPEIFKQAGSSAQHAYNDTIWIGVINMAFTIVAISLIDKVGRKPLLLVGTAGMGLSLLLVGLAFQFGISGTLLLAVILAYVACFAASQGPVVWVIISEIFPTRVRGRAVSIATVILWGACFLVSQTFPMLIDEDEGIGPAPTFWIYAGICAVTVVFTWRFVPETKGKSLEQIESELGGW